MYLSRIEPSANRTVRDVMSQVRSGYDAHRVTWQWFGDRPDRRRDFLFRVDQRPSGPSFLVLSERVPVTGNQWEAETKHFEPKLNAGDRLAFSIRVNPTVKRRSDYRSKRHDVLMDRKWKARASGDVTEDPADGAAEEWLKARGGRLGFEVVAARATEARRQRFTRKGGDIRITTVDLEGLLEVRDVAAFLKTLRAGVGPAKGFGCGLLLIRRPR